MTHRERFLAAIHGQPVDRAPVFPLLMFFAASRAGLSYRDTRSLLPQMAACGADLFNVDHLVPLARAKAVYAAAGKCFKGNLDPVAQMMQATPEECEAHAFRCLAEAAGARYMLSPGCEVPADTSDEVFRRFCEAPGVFFSEAE
jgi:uroporphyrinogen-III decarboxylase